MEFIGGRCVPDCCDDLLWLDALHRSICILEATNLHL
jgi:hypothetical protein